MVTVNGKDYNGDDFNSSTNPYGFGAGGHKEIVAPATDPNYIQLAADIIADGTNALQTTSTSTVSIGTGAKTWVMAAARPFIAGQRVRLVNQDDTTEYMSGIVTSWTLATLTLIVDVDVVNGSGSSSDWISTLDGEKGDTGDISYDDFQKQDGVYVVSTGSSNAYVLTPSPAITAYTEGHRLAFRANFANTGPATANANGVGAVNIFHAGAALIGGEIQINQLVEIEHDGTQWNIMSLINKNIGWTKLVDIGTPADGDYVVARSIPVGFELLAIKSECESGTCTATVKINSTALGGTANAVSSTPQTQTHSSANTAAADDNIVVTISSNASCNNLTLWAKIRGNVV